MASKFHKNQDIKCTGSPGVRVCKNGNEECSVNMSRTMRTEDIFFGFMKCFKDCKMELWVLMQCQPLEPNSEQKVWVQGVRQCSYSVRIYNQLHRNCAHLKARCWARPSVTHLNFISAAWLPCSLCHLPPHRVRGVRILFLVPCVRLALKSDSHTHAHTHFCCSTWVTRLLCHITNPNGNKSFQLSSNVIDEWAIICHLINRKWWPVRCIFLSSSLSLSLSLMLPLQRRTAMMDCILKLLLHF